ncbi:growth-regulating factor 8-like [Rutidosis leptorrhynchoides]|uniref:growth-regulating factor 8-like n=1 Tax=Rutidosis leptorrhynchoides TaxID=125765 RepID=UPI003A99388E
MPHLPFYQQDHLQKAQDFTEIGGLKFSSGVSLEPCSGSNSRKVVFTTTQWEELERQTMIFKYIMASIPVPPQLLIPLSTQSTKVGMDLRFSNGSDSEPWRCRRTDGKKWRCSRDVAPDQKYCERHAHKSRPRSRKPVEIQSHNTKNALTITPAYSTTRSNTHMISATPSSFQNPRCTEWYKNDTVPMPSSNEQFQHPMNSPRVESKGTHMMLQEFEGNRKNESQLKNFIDAWSRSGESDSCSLTLSMQCSGGINDDDSKVSELTNGDVLKSHNEWLNHGSWMGSPPGGPLGEALGLGIASTVNGPFNIPSSRGPSSSSTISKSCENGGDHGHPLSFIK